MKNFVFIGNKLEKLKKRVVTSDSKQFSRLIEMCNLYKSEILTKDHPPKSTTYMGIACLNLSLAYLLTEQDEYLIEAKRWMLTVTNYKDWGNAHLVNVDLSAAWILFGLSLSYNWLKSSLSKEESEQIKNKLIKQTTIMHDYYKANIGKGWATQYYQNHNWINLTGIAAAGYSLKSETPLATEWIKSAKDNFDVVYASLAEDGSDYEGVVYWRYGVLWLFIYADLVKQEEETDYFKKCSFLKNTFYYRLYQSVSDFKKTTNFGDCHDHTSAHSAAIYYKVAAEYNNSHAQYLGDLVTDKYLYQEYYESKIKPGILPEIGLEILWYDELVKPKNFDELPKFKHFEDLGLITIKSSWENDATTFSFKSGAPGGKKQWSGLWDLYNNKKYHSFGLSHQHPDNNSFILNAHDTYLASDEGYNRNVYVNQHNTISIDRKGCLVENVNDVLTSSAMKTLEEVKNFNPITDFTAEIKNVCSHKDMHIFTGSTDKTYDYNLKLKQFDRTVFWLENDLYIMLDELDSELEHTYEFNLHTETKAKFQNDMYSYINGKAKMNLFINSNKAISTNQFITSTKAVMTTQEPDKFCESIRQTLEVSNKTKSKDMNFISVFEILKINESNKYKVEKINDKNIVGFNISSKDTNHILLYSNDSKIEYGSIKTDARCILIKTENNVIRLIAVNEAGNIEVDNKNYYSGKKITKIMEV